MLNTTQKKIIREVLRYFIDTTGLSSDHFILLVQRNAMRLREDSKYEEWLAVKSYNFLKEMGISLADCLDYRFLVTQLKKEKKGINITPIWKKEIAKEILKSDINGYSLLELSDKDSEFDYISKNISKIEPGMPLSNYSYNLINAENNTSFFNTFDFDIENRSLYNLLPKEIQKVVDFNLPIFINFNPYLYKSGDLYNIVDSMKLHGFSNLSDIPYFQILFKIIDFCKSYNLTNVRIGFYGFSGMFLEEEKYLDFFKYFKSYFQFKRGICFSPKSVGLKSNEEFITYSIWDFTEQKLGKSDKRLVLNERVQLTPETIVKGVDRLFRGIRESLYAWCNKSIIEGNTYREIPLYLNYHIKSDEKIKQYSNELCYILNSKNVLRSLKKIGTYSVPFGEYNSVTLENWPKMIASFVVRCCLNDKLDSSSVYLSSPDMSIRGYKEWVADSLIFFLFSPFSMHKSYREKDLKMGNRVFPLSFSEVRKYVTDENIIMDMNSGTVENLDFVSILSDVLNDVSSDGMDLYRFCRQKIIKSLLGKTRENVGYNDSLVAWDASFYQIRSIPDLFDKKDEETYQYLYSKLKEKLSKDLYKYGFISDLVNI